jgi:hypothetical protein
MNRREKFQIEQVIPASGWTAAFVNISSGERFEVPLVAWALARPETLRGHRFVVGIVAQSGGTELCEETNPGFLGYFPPPGAPGSEHVRDKAKALAATIMTDQQGARVPSAR